VIAPVFHMGWRQDDLSVVVAHPCHWSAQELNKFGAEPCCNS